MHVVEKTLWDLLEVIPEPKLRHLEMLVAAMAYEKFGNQVRAGGYIGLKQAKMSQLMRRGAMEIKERIGKSLWEQSKQNKKQLPPGSVVPLDSFEDADDEIQRLIDEGKVIVREINRNEL